MLERFSCQIVTLLQLSFNKQRDAVCVCVSQCASVFPCDFMSVSSVVMHSSHTITHSDPMFSEENFPHSTSIARKVAR